MGLHISIYSFSSEPAVVSTRSQWRKRKIWHFRKLQWERLCGHVALKNRNVHV